MTTYAASGVDVDIEEKAAKILYASARATWHSRAGRVGHIVTPVDDFSGVRAIQVAGLPNGTILSLGFDGVGTKAEFAEAAGRYDTLAYDLLAMVTDDAVIRGGEPILVGSILDVNTLGTNETRLAAIKSLAEGYTAAAEAADVAVINGEIAQLGDRLGASDQLHLSWGASCLWLANEARLITGHDIQPGDTIVALPEPGLRSNGISLIRHVFANKYGSKWHDTQLEGESLLNLSLAPSTIYAPVITDMTGGWDLAKPAKAVIHGLAHITGGGVAGKLARALRPSGLGAVIDGPLEPPAIMTHAQSVGEISDYEAYRTWHMGQGMLIITPEPHPVLALARGHHLAAAVVGSITSDQTIRIASRGHFAATKRWIEYAL